MVLSMVYLRPFHVYLGVSEKLIRECSGVILYLCRSLSLIIAIMAEDGWLWQ